MVIETMKLDTTVGSCGQGLSVVATDRKRNEFQIPDKGP